MVNLPVLLFNKAKVPSTLLSLKYFPREESISTLFGEHPIKKRTIKEKYKNLIIVGKIFAKITMDWWDLERIGDWGSW
jgi:hypothetical protein